MTGHRTDPPRPEDRGGGAPALLPSLLEDSAEDLYENAPCGYLSTLLNGQIAKINTTLLKWLGYAREELVGLRTFSDLLTAGGRLYHETHFAPLLTMQGAIGGVALELRAADGTRLPVLVTSTVKCGADGRPQLIRTTVFDASDRRAYERELLRARREAEVERERLQRLFATLQRSLLPPSLPAVPGLEAAAYYHIASRDRVSGDFYDVFQLTADRWGFFLGDVCGKGAAAAAVTSLIRYTLRAAAVYDFDPVTVLDTLNTALHRESHGDDPRFCTVIFGILTPDGDGFSVTLASGGHPPCLLLRADGAAEYQTTPDGLLVGVFPGATFTARRIRLAPGDTLLLYTDGLTEARTAAGSTPDGRYGEPALRAFAARLAPAGAAGIIAALAVLLDGFGDGLGDDAAALALGVPSPRARGALTG
ncbi:SpoIIE family protein phosphatase [Sphaerisporangium sp. TRM90804]|uniref:SpoIIE family protein phosphatase n=1 Tax=Sphaerisporangium sp. TRM90804 TaxID=3031113 RepID=UPI002447F332|nr:SpoIIE family protein phosphatase [Sphaerisporangium sp. TRM90804]MDH2425978.1 SpoIIE family protein phosphatase [Sphaerisporangium sp. TRM90804]